MPDITPENLKPTLNLLKRSKVINLIFELKEEEIDFDKISQIIETNTLYKNNPEIIFIKEELDLFGEDYIEENISKNIRLIKYEKQSENIISYIREKITHLSDNEFLYKKQLGQTNVIKVSEEKTTTRVEKTTEGYVVFNSRAERLVVLPDQRSFAARIQLRKELNTMGVIAALEKAGVKQGDSVTIGKKEFIWE